MARMAGEKIAAAAGKNPESKRSEGSNDGGRRHGGRHHQGHDHGKPNDNGSRPSDGAREGFKNKIKADIAARPGSPSLMAKKQDD